MRLTLTSFALLVVSSFGQPLNDFDEASRDYTLHAVNGVDNYGQTQSSFTVLQIPDMHYTGNPKYPCNGPPFNPCWESNMTDFINELLDQVKPNIVVFTGDQVENTGIRHTAEEVKKAIDTYSTPVAQRQIPWAMVFGNHDEGSSFTRTQMLNYIASRPYAYSQSGPTNVDGKGNYELQVQTSNGKTSFRMYFLDTGVKGSISKKQNDYIRQLAASHKNENALAVMFYHIPVPEYILGPSETITYGHQGEKVSNGPQSGLMDTIVQMGDVKATFVGHDHYNDYCIERRGVQLCYGGGVGYGAAYGSSSLPRSARVIQWKRNSTDEVLTTWKQAKGDFSIEEYLLFKRGV
ncbi:calcineurin-like phosphoesterase [Thraustotheca clavata]|uniref:Calcineurin-like phosphoesterase n=1 Tax=Thraustotheca clavata TaxID=74557 RepID=A0A1W0A171_9STRA|nr:calcineurin-like phosphoesterase [Thraustotheca clavata]